MVLGSRVKPHPDWVPGFFSEDVAEVHGTIIKFVRSNILVKWDDGEEDLYPDLSLAAVATVCV